MAARLSAKAEAYLAAFFQREILPVEADVVDGHGAGRDSFGGEPSAQRRRIDGEHAGDGRRVVRHVEPGTEPYFEDLSL